VYSLYKARHLHDAVASLSLPLLGKRKREACTAPELEITPDFLRDRVERGGSLPTVALTCSQEGGGDDRRREVLGFVIQEMKTELFTELSEMLMPFSRPRCGPVCR
jgi:hypothetical protein